MHLAGGTAEEEALLCRSLGDWTRSTTDAWLASGLPHNRSVRLSAILAKNRAMEEISRAAGLGARLVPLSAPSMPRSVVHLHRPPVLLAILGRWPPPQASIAIVGSRAATSYGLKVAKKMAAISVRGNLAVVSGLARGIDKVALQTTLDHGGWPVAVLGCGLDVVYPPEHRDLQATIAREGTLISEFPLGQRPTRHAFPRRNRLISAFADKVLVIEAAQRSGALITAGHALEQGKEVLAVPGPIDSPLSAGTNRLIFDGAAPILDEKTLLLHFGWSLPPDAPKNASQTAPTALRQEGN